MRSSTGQHFIGLDHVRALAAVLVFAWHFIHQGRAGVPLDHAANASPLLFPLALFDEGHVGVAMFMTLSGYLFAKLLDGRSVVYWRFLLNRSLRLFPLLIFVFLIAAGQRWWNGQHLAPFVQRLIDGFVFPTWPNNGWSIAVEIHFYLLLPVLLWAARTRYGLLWVLGVAIATRALIWTQSGEVQTIAYWTIVGRIDQFVLGILAFQWRHVFIGDHGRAVTLAVVLCGFYWWFAELGGAAGMQSVPSPTPLWIIIPFVEGATLAGLVAWYDGSFQFRDTGFSALVARVGACSYSIYLLHSFVVVYVGNWVHEHLLQLSNIYLAIVASTVSFMLFVPIAWASYICIERPALRYRVRYVRDVRDGERLPVPVARDFR